MAVMKQITWGDVQNATLQKLFSYSSTDAKTDSNNEEYVYAMPAAASEAIALLWGDVKTKGEITLAVEDLNGQIDLFDVIPDLYSVAGLAVYSYDSEGGIWEDSDLFLVGGRWLTVSDSWYENVIIQYIEKPEIITTSTSDDYVMQCGDNRALMIPLYMASQLYKDDDISIATTYRNEFEEARTNLMNVPGGAAVDTADCLGWDF